MITGTKTGTNRDAWLAERRKSLGGSDAAAILGLNPYVTPYCVWADKTGRLPEIEDNEAMRQGRDLEQYVAERFTAETGKKCRRRRRLLRQPAYPFAHANVDRWLVGENAGLECKTTKHLNLKKFKNGEYPDAYYCQCVHYMAVTGADRWYLAVLVLGTNFQVFTIQRDAAEIAALMAAEQLFWESYVVKDTPPPVDGLEPTTNTLQAIFGESDSCTDAIRLFGREPLIRQYLQCRDHIVLLEQEKARCEQQLKEDLGQVEQGECGNYAVYWKGLQRSHLDQAALRADYPEIDFDRYQRTCFFRKFQIKEC